MSQFDVIAFSCLFWFTWHYQATVSGPAIVAFKMEGQLTVWWRSWSLECWPRNIKTYCFLVMMHMNPQVDALWSALTIVACWPWRGFQQTILSQYRCGWGLSLMGRPWSEILIGRTVWTSWSRIANHHEWGVQTHGSTPHEVHEATQTVPAAIRSVLANGKQWQALFAESAANLHFFGYRHVVAWKQGIAKDV